MLGAAPRLYTVFTYISLFSLIRHRSRHKKQKKHGFLKKDFFEKTCFFKTARGGVKFLFRKGVQNFLRQPRCHKKNPPRRGAVQEWWACYHDSKGQQTRNGSKSKSNKREQSENIMQIIPKFLF